MKHIIYFILFITFSAPAQELKLIKATKQTINAGASPSSVTNYVVIIKKEKCFKWSVDSVVNIDSRMSVKYNIVKADNPNAASPNYQRVQSFSKKDKGLYHITFSSSKSHSSGRPGSPLNTSVTTPEFTRGALIYYSAGKKKKQLQVNSFEQLATIDAP